MLNDTLNVVTVSDTGSYTVLVSNPCSTVVSQPATVSWRKTPVVTYENTIFSTFLCQGETATLIAKISGAYDSLYWMKDAIRISGADDSIYVTSDIGVYKVQVFSCGTLVQNIPTLVVMVNPKPVFTITPSENPITICKGTTVTLKANTNSPTPYKWSWNTGSIADSLVVGVADTFIVTATARYMHPADSSVVRECYTTQSRVVEVDNTTNAAFSSTVMPQTAPAKVVFTNKSSSASVTYFWDFGDHTSSTEKNPVHTYALPLVYKVKLVAYNSRGCIDSTIREVRAVPDLLYMPNTFTPNSDGINDFFKIAKVAEEAHILKGEIFDRWGKKVAEFDDNGWNGKLSNGQDAPEAVYFYVVRLQLPNTSPTEPVYMEKGSVTLIRGR
jgi:gliding motility-associated-like protein